MTIRHPARSRPVGRTLGLSVMLAVTGAVLAVVSRHPNGSWSVPAIVMGVGFELVAVFMALAIARGGHPPND